MIPLAIVGYGKIAQEEHAPALARSTDFALSALVTHHAADRALPQFATLAELHQARPDITAVVLCTPPLGRLALVAEALSLGLDVMLEKPPAATLSEAEALAALAAGDRVIYAAWHARQSVTIAPAVEWLAGKTVARVDLNWQEDVRDFHPGQDWMWQPGIGVFDPGINALSVVSKLLAGPVLLKRAKLRFPANKCAPIAADLTLSDRTGTPISIALDMNRPGPHTWEIEIVTDAGTMLIAQHSAQAWIDGIPVELPYRTEYDGMYSRFAELITARRSDVDLTPFRLVADTYMIGERVTVPAFEA